MEISDELIEEFGKAIQPVRSAQFKSFSDEVSFIEATIAALDNIRIEVDANGGQSLWTITKQMHLTPRVEFFWPIAWEKTQAELADLLFIVSVYEDQIEPVKRRTVLSQSKFTRRPKVRYSPRFSWKIAPHQYYLLEELPAFRVVQPKLKPVYQLDSIQDSLSTYSFASDSWLPFFQTTSDMRDPVEYDRRNRTDMTYKRQSHPGGMLSMFGYLKEFARANRGQPIERYNSIYSFYSDLFSSNVSFRGETSGRTVPDGGYRATDFGMPGYLDRLTSNERKPFGIIQIVVYDDGLPTSDEFFPDDPLYLG